MKNAVGGFFRRVLLCSAAAAPSVVAISAEESQDAPIIRLGETVVTPTRTSEPLEKVGSAVTVVTREEIEQSQIRAFPDILRRVPGISVVQSGRPGGQVSVFTRGLNSNQTLFLIDGARVGSPLNGLVTLSNLTPDQVERIEVVRGPQSTLYGADALGGVVNIVTRKGGGPFGGSATLEGGTYNSFRQIVDMWGASKKFSGALSFSHVATDNPYPNDDYENFTVGGSATYQVTPKLQLNGTIRYTNAENGLPGPVGVQAPNLTERLRNETLFARIGAEWTLFDIWQQSFFISENHEKLLDRGDPIAISDAVSDTLQIGWQNNVRVAKWNTITAGLDWFVNRGEYQTVGSTPFDKTIRTTAGYLQDQATFGRVSLTGGVRYDDNSRFGSRFTYRGAGVVRFDETGTRIKGSIGTGFKAPTLNDLYLDFPGFASFGNPALKPEKSVGWDIGFEQDLGRILTAEARYFENDIRDLITFTNVGPIATTINVDRARTRGIESSVQVRPMDGLTLWASYTWLAEAKNLTTDSRLLRRPEHTGTIGGNYHFLERYNVNSTVTLVSARADIDAATFGPATNRPYAKWDLALSADLNRHFRIFGRVENILDDRYEEANGYPALGRVFWGGITAKF
jgi:vitamin B12 transporter